MTTEAERLARELDNHESLDWSDVSALLRSQAAEIERKDALLRQALEALAKYTTPGVLGGRMPIDAELAAAIKQHLGKV